MASYDWQLEMENMLAAFNRQTMHSLSIIQLAFKWSDMSFTPEFKKYFMQASNNRISEAYDQFQLKTMVEKQLNVRPNSVAIMSPRNGTNGVERETDDREKDTSFGDESDWRTNASDSVIQIDEFFDDESVIGAVEIEPTDDKTLAENDASSSANPHETENDTISTQNISDTYDCNEGSTVTDDLYKTNELIPHQLNESYMIDLEAGNDSKFAVDDSNDSVDLVEHQSDSTDADNDELTTLKIASNRLDETALAKLTKRKIKTMPLNRKYAYKKQAAQTKDASKNQPRCGVCGRASSSKNMSRHMRTHTGEKPHRCDRCGSSFTNKASLMKHAATHIEEFPFHCQACFHGFSSKTEAVAHEKQCQKRRYECHICKKFVTCIKRDLIIHMRTHTGNKPFRCEICMKHFGRKQDLKRHLNNVHSRINP